MRSILFVWELALVLGADAWEWARGSRWVRWVAVGLCVALFFLLLGVVGAIENAPLRRL